MSNDDPIERYDSLEALDRAQTGRPPPPRTRRVKDWQIVLGAVVALMLFAALIVRMVFGLIAGSVPYQAALAAVRESPEAVEILGEPIEAGWLVSGNISTTNDEGDADVSIPVNGPKAEGRVHIVAQRIDSVWYPQRIVLYGEGFEIELDTPAAE